MPFTMACLVAVSCTDGGKNSPTSLGNSWPIDLFHDYGPIFEGDEISYSFLIANPLESPLKVTHFSKTCLCADAWLVLGGKELNHTWVNALVNDPPVLKPGVRAFLKMVLNFSGILGTKDGTATLRLTDSGGNHHFAKFKLQATSRTPFKVEPNPVNLGTVHWSERKDFSFALRSDYIDAWRVVDWKSNLLKGLTLCDPKEVRDTGRIAFHFHGSFQPSNEFGRVGGKSKIKTSFNDRCVEVPIEITVIPPVEVLPSQYVNFGLIRMKEGKRATITIKNNDAAHALEVISHEVTGPDSSRKIILAMCDCTKPGTEYVISISVLPAETKGSLSGKISLKLNDPRIPTIDLFLSGMIR